MTVLDRFTALRVAPVRFLAPQVEGKGEGGGGGGGGGLSIPLPNKLVLVSTSVQCFASQKATHLVGSHEKKKWPG